jgi:hypothetical protein
MHFSRLSCRGLAGAALAVVLLLAASGCSDDKSDTSEESTLSTQQTAFCKVARAADDDAPEVRATKLAEAAPDDIKPDVDAMKKFFDLSADPKADEIQKAEASNAALSALPRLAQYMKDTCGITVNLYK